MNEEPFWSIDLGPAYIFISDEEAHKIWTAFAAHFGAKPETIVDQERAKNRAAHLKGLIDEVNADPTIANVS